MRTAILIMRMLLKIVPRVQGSLMMMPQIQQMLEAKVLWQETLLLLPNKFLTAI